jgi:hypothetical protein
MTRSSLLGAMLIGIATTGWAQQPTAPPAAIPTNTYSGYAHADCGPADSPTVRIMLPAGSVPVPETLPASPPRPRVEVVVSGPLERALGQEITIVPEPIGSAPMTANALSCPLMGNCSRAQRGRLTLQRAADGTLTGEFRARWPDEAARQTDVIGKFSAVWFASQKICG